MFTFWQYRCCEWNGIGADHPIIRRARCGIADHVAKADDPGHYTIRRQEYPMIRNFSDHAANERTFLAWVRTAIAVMAFGFLVAKFDLFLKSTAQSLTGGREAARISHSGFGGAVGVVLILAGTLMVALSTVRFVRTSRAIDSADPSTDREGVDLVLAGLMVALGVALLLYLAHTLLAWI